MWQAEWVASQLTERGNEVELIQVSTKGDVSQASLSQVGGQGLFTKEIQNELLAGNVDVAVHSLKDLPTVEISELELAAVPQRETTLDCLVSRENLNFEGLPPGARVGTGSSRRGAQLSAWRSDIEIKDIRGNVDSRLRKLKEGQYDAIVLAAAGLTRLGLYEEVTEELSQERVLPAIGQGALGLECRADDMSTKEALTALNHQPSFNAVVAERQLLASLLAGCLAPVAALGSVVGGELHLKARVLNTDGSQLIEGVRSGRQEHAKQIGEELADSLRTQGAAELIATARQIEQ